MGWNRISEDKPESHVHSAEGTKTKVKAKAKLLRIAAPNQTTVPYNSYDGQATQVQTGTENSVSIHMGFDEN